MPTRSKSYFCHFDNFTPADLFGSLRTDSAHRRRSSLRLQATGSRESSAAPLQLPRRLLSLKPFYLLNICCRQTRKSRPSTQCLSWGDGMQAESHTPPGRTTTRRLADFPLPQQPQPPTYSTHVPLFTGLPSFTRYRTNVRIASSRPKPGEASFCCCWNAVVPYLLTIVGVK